MHDDPAFGRRKRSSRLCLPRDGLNHNVHHVELHPGWRPVRRRVPVPATLNVSTLSFSLVHWGVRERELTMHRGALTLRHRGQKGSERERAAIREERAHDA